MRARPVVLLPQELDKQLKTVVVVDAGEDGLQFQVSLCRENDGFCRRFIAFAHREAWGYALQLSQHKLAEFCRVELTEHAF